MQRLTKLLLQIPSPSYRMNQLLRFQAGVGSVRTFSIQFQRLNEENNSASSSNHPSLILKKYLPREYHRAQFQQMLKSASNSPSYETITQEILENQMITIDEGINSKEEFEKKIILCLRALRGILDAKKSEPLKEPINQLFMKLLDIRSHKEEFLNQLEPKKLSKILGLIKGVEQQLRKWQIQYDKTKLDQLIIQQSRKEVKKEVSQNYGKFLEYLMKEDELTQEDLVNFDQYIKRIQNQSRRGFYNFADLTTLQLLNRYILKRKGQGKWQDQEQHYLLQINLDVKKLSEAIKEVQGKPLILSQRVWALLQLLDSQNQDAFSVYSKFIIFVFNYVNASNQDQTDLFFSNQNQSDLSNVSFNVIYFDILPVIMANLETFNIRDLQVILEGLTKTFSKLNKTCPELQIILEKLRKHLTDNKIVPAPLIMSVIGSLRILRYDDQKIFGLVIERIKASQRLLKDFELLIFVAKAFAGMGLNDKFKTLLEIIKFGDYYKSRLISCKHMVELLYFMSETQVFEPTLLQWCLSQLSLSANMETLRIPHLALVFHRMFKMACLSLESTHPELCQKYELQKFREFNTSDRESEVVKISNPHKRFMLRLMELGYEFETEKEIKLDGILIRKDLYMTHHNLIVEIDGPPHYKLNKPTEKLVPMKLEERLLTKQGYEYFRIGVEFQNQLLQQTSQEGRNHVVDQYLLQHKFPEYAERLAKLKEA